ncbi:hypothetical protein [Leeia sp.]|uniref:hypothetical protein n=1 Tax=Leeia sp. TaxID=2884678 RepID=UPI0035B00E94
MTHLLAEVIEAHGGMARWQETARIRASVSATGGLFSAKGHPDTLADVEVEVSCHQPRAIYTPFPAVGQTGIFQPSRVAIMSHDDAVLCTRTQPREAFSDPAASASWDDLSLLYFGGYAIWNYLCAPFFLSGPGFTVTEGDGWEEEGELWRRLQVTFPEGFPTHSRQQVFYVDEARQLRRLDYQADIMGGVPVAHYMSAPQDCSGLRIPTQRRAYPRGPDNQANKARCVVEVTLSNITLGCH